MLEYICTRYKNTLEVKFRIPMNDYSQIGVADSDELCKLLVALSKWTQAITWNMTENSAAQLMF